MGDLFLASRVQDYLLKAVLFAPIGALGVSDGRECSHECVVAGGTFSALSSRGPLRPTAKRTGVASRLPTLYGYVLGCNDLQTGNPRPSSAENRTSAAKLGLVVPPFEPSLPHFRVVPAIFVPNRLLPGQYFESPEPVIRGFDAEVLHDELNSGLTHR